MENKNKNKSESMKKFEPQVNPKAKYLLIGIAIVLIIAVIAIVLSTSDSSKKSVGDGNNDSSVNTVVPDKVYTPTFKYFVEKSDENYAEYMAIVDELKEEYDGRVNFDIVDIADDPEATKNFPVTSETTPFLIMLNTENNPSAIEMSCADKDQLKADIEAALK